jgi:hypothetical protein
MLSDKYKFEERGMINVKGKGKMNTYFIVSKVVATAPVETARPTSPSKAEDTTKKEQRFLRTVKLTPF